MNLECVNLESRKYADCRLCKGVDVDCPYYLSKTIAGILEANNRQIEANNKILRNHHRGEYEQRHD